MKIIGLNGKEYKLKLKEAEFSDENRSSLHLKCRSLLKEIYPSDSIFEEIGLPGTKDLTVDFIIPLRRLIIECQGRQHYHMTSFFCKTREDFNKGKIRDSQKKEWAILNGFLLVELRYDETEEEWKRKILNVFNT